MQLKIDFEAPYQEDDPWGYGSSWYEERRRELMLACLPRRGFTSALEVGCATGLFTRGLAARAQNVLAIDCAQQAVAWSGRETSDLRNVCVLQASVPDQWPLGTFELIVMADVGYYLDAAALAGCVRAVEGSLAGDGVLLAAHWRHAFEQAQQSQAAVHAALARCTGAELIGFYEDADLRIDVWSRDHRSVAALEGLA